MIEVLKISKRYGKVEALKDISFEVKEGEILGFLGPNGAGKTTTMKILTGFFPPSSGKVYIGGVDFSKHTIDLKKRIGYLPENVPLYYDMSVKDFLSFAASLKKIKGKQRRLQIDSVISECSLESVEEKLIKTLSKGYKQRVGIAQALLGDPEIVILDEPTIGLDPKQIIEIRNLIKKMAGKKTVILSTHILPEVSMICDRVIIINQGKIIAIDTPDNLNEKLASKTQIRMIITGETDTVVNLLEKVDNVESVRVGKQLIEGFEYFIESDRAHDIRSDLIKTIVRSRKKVEVLEAQSVGMSLEDIFLQLVTKEDVEYA